jgi:NADPH:quinone reductase-like Zn-dependent oxidoreductase
LPTLKSRSRPANQILIEVKAAGINFAELELTWGKYPALRPLPYVLGFEAAGIIAEIGSHVENLKVGDKVTATVSSGGYAEYATADVPELLNLIAQGRVKLFANTAFPLSEVKKAYEAFSSRHTIGKVVLTP